MAEREGRLVVGRYRLTRPIGQGGMGVVWRAHDEYLHRDVAIKEILQHGRQFRDTDPEVRRALREARAAAMLSEHPGIVTVYDVVQDEHGLPMIVMELLSGSSLRETLDRDGPMPLDQAARIGVQMLGALDYAHTNGVLHRDVKPGNVMLVGNRVVLTDFGIAVIDGDSALTATGQVPGAPEYISPERFLGSEALPAADLWSVGITLYGMVIGRSPFQRKDIQATVGAVLSQEPDPNPGVGRMWPVIQGLLRKKPAERMDARQAIDRLTELTALPASAPDGTRVRYEPPTLPEDPAGATTAIDATVPNTKTQPPPLPPLAKRVGPDSPTLDPFPRGRKSRRGPLLVAGAVLVVAAVIVTIVVATRSDGDQSSAAPPTTTQQTTTPTPVNLKTYRELGVEIGIPPDWRREPSAAGAVSHVVWEGARSDPKDGVLTVRVLRDTTAPNVSALAYLTDEAKVQRGNRDNVDFQQLVLSDGDSSADLEYTHGSAAGSPWFHTWIRATAKERTVYTLTFSLYAGDPRTLGSRWQATQPLITQIRDSFRLSS